jgi:uncharacterized protein (TIGR01777 family)
METVLITGGTGFIGTALTKALLAKNYDVIILTRNPASSIRHPVSGIRYPASAIRYASWNIKAQTIDKDAIARADHIIHLAGANVGEKRWTVKRKNEILESRTQSSSLLVKALKEIPNNVKTVISASGMGWYGPDPVIPNPHPFIETDPAFEDFLGETCKQWEESLDPISELGKRLVKLRTGIVFGDGGALEEFKKPLRFGLATILGNGKQVMSWIHIDDLVSLYIYALENNEMTGVYNAVAPHPANNKTIVLRLAKITRGKFFIPVYVPSFVLKIVLGEMSIEVLKSAAVSCGKVIQAGFNFLHPTIISAIRRSGA